MQMKNMTDRKYTDQYINRTFKVKADFPWIKHPTFAVYRHKNNKWFAVVMDIPKSKLGLETEEIISVVNLKSAPLLIGSLHKENGIFPAYHMNKSHWITILLDGSVEEEKLKLLLNMSYDMTLKKTKK
jgi:predicted DNA-binding protein (MmcQ/YjbR family)